MMLEFRDGTFVVMMDGGPYEAYNDSSLGDRS